MRLHEQIRANAGAKPKNAKVAPQRVGIAADGSSSYDDDMELRRMISYAERPFIFLPGADPSFAEVMAGAMRRAIRRQPEAPGDADTLAHVRSVTVHTDA